MLVWAPTWGLGWGIWDLAALPWAPGSRRGAGGGGAAWGQSGGCAGGTQAASRSCSGATE